MDYGMRKVSCASFDVKVGNPKQNVKEIIRLVKEAENEKVSVLTFPELSLTGYTCGDLFLQSKMKEDVSEALSTLVKEVGNVLTIVGAPIRKDGMLFNVAIIIHHQKILAMVPKSYIPNYGEFYEKRWFVPASCRKDDTIVWNGETVPFTPNIIIHLGKYIQLSCEICEDLWVACPPSGAHAGNGANLIVNPSASDEIATKKEYRRDLVKIQSGKCICSYVYCSSGTGESTTDLIFSGHNIIAANGSIAKEEQYTDGLMSTVIDFEKLENDKIKNNSMAFHEPFHSYCHIYTEEENSFTTVLPEHINAYPFVPADKKVNLSRCDEIFSLQVKGLEERLRKTGMKKVVIGVSGGLDSTLALLVITDAFARLNLPMENIIAITMPGFGTTSRTKGNAEKLMELLKTTCLSIDITAACIQHMKDIGHEETCYDVTFENVQARERTQILMDMANQENGLVIGTGDLSELALGWCTYNGDHMSMYAVNAGVPKTLVKYLVNAKAYYYQQNQQEEIADILLDITDTPISPELLPTGDHGEMVQKTEDSIGKYDLHDFFLYHFLRNGFSEEKLVVLAGIAFPKVSNEEIQKTVKTFFHRFYSQQFKRSCLPDGPKVGTISLSPRGDFRMPSDVKYDA